MDSKNQSKPPLSFVSKSSDTRRMERRKLPRLSITTEQFKLAKNGKIFSTHDLSLHGMALWIAEPEDLEFFSIGMTLEGTLNLRREKYSVHLKVRNLSRDRVGCEFENLSSVAHQALEKFLSPAVLGAELKPIPSSEDGVLWYHAFSGTDLVFRDFHDRKHQRFTLYVLGYFVNWDQALGLSTGLVQVANEKSEVRGVVRVETLLLDADDTPDLQKLNIAKTVILSSNLPDDLKVECVKKLS